MVGSNRQLTQIDILLDEAEWEQLDAELLAHGSELMDSRDEMNPPKRAKTEERSTPIRPIVFYGSVTAWVKEDDGSTIRLIVDLNVNNQDTYLDTPQFFSNSPISVLLRDNW